MTVGSSKIAAPVVLEFCNLQCRLVGRFLEDIRPNDLERFSDIERVGMFKVGSQLCRYTRHGAGVLFESPMGVVDAHVGLALFPSAIDGWRLLQYLESIGVNSINFEGETVAADDVKGLERLLEKMAQTGVLKTVYLPSSRRLFCPSQNRGDHD